MESEKPYKFVTNQRNLTTYLYVNQDGKFQKEAVFIPQAFERMSQKQIQQYKQQYNLKFLIWTMLNREKIKNATDKRVILSRAVDLNSGVLVSIGITFLLKTLFKKIESPYMDYYFHDLSISFAQFKKFTAYATGAYFLYAIVSSSLNINYIFDLGLEYKEHIAPKELISDNCEARIQQLSQ